MRSASRVARRSFCRAVLALPACAIGGSCAGTPTGPLPVSRDVAAGTPPVSADVVPFAPAGPTGLLPLIIAQPLGEQLVLSLGGTALEMIGGVARTEGAANGLFHYVLLVRTGSDTVSALNGICTHEGCVVNRFAATVFECPCHGSQYDWRGTVVRGPAPANLPGLATEFDGRTLRVRTRG
jgi:Rieske Fe-S protein